MRTGLRTGGMRTYSDGVSAVGKDRLSCYTMTDAQSSTPPRRSVLHQGGPVTLECGGPPAPHAPQREHDGRVPNGSGEPLYVALAYLPRLRPKTAGQ